MTNLRRARFVIIGAMVLLALSTAHAFAGVLLQEGGGGLGAALTNPANIFAALEKGALGLFLWFGYRQLIATEKRANEERARVDASHAVALKEKDDLLKDVLNAMNKGTVVTEAGQRNTERALSVIEGLTGGIRALETTVKTQNEIVMQAFRRDVREGGGR